MADAALFFGLSDLPIKDLCGPGAPPPQLKSISCGAQLRASMSMILRLEFIEEIMHLVVFGCHSFSTRLLVS